SSSYSESPEHTPPRPGRPEITSNYLASVFIEPQLALFKDLYLSGGVRLDQSDSYDQVVTPRAGFSYHVRDHLLRFSYADAFRAPKPWDYTDGLGNLSLLPEKMNSLEAAGTFSIIDRCKLDVIVYKNSLDKAIAEEITDQGHRWVNSGGINTDGAELVLGYAARPFKASLNYTYTKSRYESGESVPEISRHGGNASITCSLFENITINLRANYIGKRKNPTVITATNGRDIEPCLLFHGTLSLLYFKGFTVQLTGKNLLDEKWYHPSNRGPDRYRQPQRTVMLMVGYAGDY
ncbi:MAG: TonB-dependent receptor, partial [Chitinispirillaceae bacterium]|nr:TonB-dependent receptor [Chitinispirillaceae bacterium]